MISPQLFEFLTKKSVRGISLGVSQEEIKMKLWEADDFALLGKRNKTTIFQNVRPTSPMNGTIYTAAAKQGGIGRIDNGVGWDFGDVSLDYFDHGGKVK